MGLVLFIDMDSFYASCELLRRPELRGKAFIVGTSDEKHKEKGVVETASYAAKKAGIRSAMPVASAMKIKPDVIYVPSDHDYYDSISSMIMNLLKAYAFRTEVLSVDEAALDLGDTDIKKAEALAKKIKEQINEQLHLPCTIGVSTGKTLAKMVCDAAKPDGLMIVPQNKVVEFLADKEVDRIPGVGPKTKERLEKIGITTVRDLAVSNPSTVMNAVGSFGAELCQLANGHDNSEVVDVWTVLSIGRERTLENKTVDFRDIDKMLDELSVEVYNELKKQNFRYRTVTVKGRYNDFTEKLKSKTLHGYTDSLEVLKSTAHELIREIVADKPVRKVGVRVSSFENESEKRQKRLF